MFQEVPPPRLVVRAQEQDGLGIGTTPENAWPFQAQVDDAAHGTLDGAAPDRQLQGHQLRIGHATLIPDEIVEMRADRLAITPTTSLQCVAQICSRRIAVLRSQATMESGF